MEEPDNQFATYNDSEQIQLVSDQSENLIKSKVIRSIEPSSCKKQTHDTSENNFDDHRSGDIAEIDDLMEMNDVKEHKSTQIDITHHNSKHGINNVIQNDEINELELDTIKSSIFDIKDSQLSGLYYIVLLYYVIYQCIILI